MCLSDSSGKSPRSAGSSRRPLWEKSPPAQRNVTEDLSYPGLLLLGGSGIILAHWWQEYAASVAISNTYRAHYVANTMARPRRHAPYDRKNHQRRPELAVEASLHAVPVPMAIGVPARVAAAP
ncbi:hypothetical protein LA080_005465 [Diaporthe eres]|nr:hypothetical protein LA080_005465 [Diaporthe eres]